MHTKMYCACIHVHAARPLCQLMPMCAYVRACANVCIRVCVCVTKEKRAPASLGPLVHGNNENNNPY